MTADAAVPMVGGIVRPPIVPHALRAMRAIVMRELFKFVHQFGRTASALVRPALWLVVFAAGIQNLFGVAPQEPYSTYVTYQEYIIPGLIGMVLLFNGMQSSLSLVYDREVGTMRLLLTAPLPRWYLLFCKLVAGTILSLVQVYAFLIVADLVGNGHLFGFEIWRTSTTLYVAWGGWLAIAPLIFLAGLMLGSVGLLLSVYVKQLENFAGTMNFVIFPMFFLSSALYPLWKLRESGAVYLEQISSVNPFTHAIELMRFTAYGHFNWVNLAVVVGVALVCFMAAVIGYDPQRGVLRRKQQG